MRRPRERPGDAYTRERLETMLEFLTVMTGLFDEVLRMPVSAHEGRGEVARESGDSAGEEKKKAG